jgi:hypothetical protein
MNPETPETQRRALRTIFNLAADTSPPVADVVIDMFPPQRLWVRGYAPSLANWQARAREARRRCEWPDEKPFPPDFSEDQLVTGRTHQEVSMRLAMWLADQSERADREAEAAQ